MRALRLPAVATLAPLVLATCSGPTPSPRAASEHAAALRSHAVIRMSFDMSARSMGCGSREVPDSEFNRLLRQHLSFGPWWWPWLLSDSQIDILFRGDALQQNQARDASLCRLLGQLKGRDSLLLLPRAATAERQGFSFAVFEAVEDTTDEARHDTVYRPLSVGVFRSLGSCDSAEAILRELRWPTQACWTQPLPRHGTSPASK